ncbi:MAG: DNA-J related domain-containing protein [Pseudomonadota bacterium]
MTPIDARLCDAVDAIIGVAGSSLSEYELIQHLNQQGWALSTDASDSLGLFSTHFLVYNSLYFLQDHYWQKQQFLEISALSVRLHAKVAAEPGGSRLSAYQGEQSLRDYYLDKNNLEEATEASVQQLLNDFWAAFVSTDESADAYSVFDLSPSADYRQVKQRYRQLAMSHHPDRGGDAKQFQRLNWAFGVLQRVYKSQ